MGLELMNKASPHIREWLDFNSNSIHELDAAISNEEREQHKQFLRNKRDELIEISERVAEVFGYSLGGMYEVTGLLLYVVKPPA